MTEKNMLKKSATLAAAGLVVAGALLAGCGESEATPMDDAYAGNSGETEKSQEEQSQSQSNGSDSSDGSDSSSSHNDPSTTTSDKKDTGNYKDGNYSINGQYGPVGEDSIDVHLTIKDGSVETVNIIGHPFTTIPCHPAQLAAERLYPGLGAWQSSQEPHQRCHPSGPSSL